MASYIHIIVTKLIDVARTLHCSLGTTAGQWCFPGTTEHEVCLGMRLAVLPFLSGTSHRSIKLNW